MPGLAHHGSPVPAEATNAPPALDLANLPVTAIAMEEEDNNFCAVPIESSEIEGELMVTVVLTNVDA
jgi:hypothetical protein